MAEDADLGIRLARYGYKIGTLDSDTTEEAPHELRNWLAQRVRWQKGWIRPVKDILLLRNFNALVDSLIEVWALSQRHRNKVKLVRSKVREQRRRLCSLTTARLRTYFNVMVRIGITPAAFTAITATLPVGSVGFEAEANEKGERLMWLDEPVVARLSDMRGPGELYQRRDPAAGRDGDGLTCPTVQSCRSDNHAADRVPAKFPPPPFSRAKKLLPDGPVPARKLLVWLNKKVARVNYFTPLRRLVGLFRCLRCRLALGCSSSLHELALVDPAILGSAREQPKAACTAGGGGSVAPVAERPLQLGQIDSRGGRAHERTQYRTN